jgi:hypothetical protein
MLSSGSLSTRLSKRIRRFPTRVELLSVYQELAECLEEGRLFGVP